MNIEGTVFKINELKPHQIEQMFSLMDKYYDNMLWNNFTRDLNDKDYVIVVFNENREIKGFSTAKLMALDVDNTTVYGVFSGDTISDIADTKSNCSVELVKYILNFFLLLSKRYKDDLFYSFLISKGYRTYRLLQYFKEFYPCYNKTTPDFEQKIIDTFGKSYSVNYNPQDGVIYSDENKDRLKKSVLKIESKHMKNPHIKYFVERNPHWDYGNELVCITRLNFDNLRNVTNKIIKTEIMEKLNVNEENIYL